MSVEPLVLEYRGRVAWLTFNRPSAMNALNREILETLHQSLAEIESKQDIRVLVLTGNGPAFSAGADLKSVLDDSKFNDSDNSFMEQVASAFERMRDVKKPSIAALNGITLAGGLEMAMCCDIIIGAEGAKIGDAHANFGIVPGGGGSAILPRLVPVNVAKYLLMTGRTMSAEQLLGYGLLQEVHPPGQLKQAAQDLAEEIAKKSPIGLNRMIEVADLTYDESLKDALLHERLMAEHHCRSLDMKEGLLAFVEKREPDFKGQ